MPVGHDVAIMYINIANQTVEMDLALAAPGVVAAYVHAAKSTPLFFTTGNWPIISATYIWLTFLCFLFT